MNSGHDVKILPLSTSFYVEPTSRQNFNVVSDFDERSTNDETLAFALHLTKRRIELNRSSISIRNEKEFANIDKKSMTADARAPKESAASEQDKKSFHFGSRILHQTVQGTKHALHRGKHAVQGTVNTVKATATTVVTPESLHKGTNALSHEPTDQAEIAQSIYSADSEQSMNDTDVIRRKEALLSQKEALLEEKGALLDELVTSSIHVSPSSKFDSLSATNLIGRNKETALLHLSIILVSYPTYKYWDILIHLPVSLVLTWLFVSFSAGNFVSFCIHRNGEPEHTIRFDPIKEAARRSSFPQNTSQSLNHPLSERSTGASNRSLFSSWSQRLFPSRRDWHLTPSFIHPLGMPASIKRWNCDPTRDHKHRQLMHNLLRNSNLRRKRKLQSAVAKSNEPTEVADLTEKQDSVDNLKASMAIGNYNLADADSFGDLDDYIIDPFFKLKGMDVFLCEADGGVPETKVADHSWFVQHGLRDAPIFLVNISTQWGNILLYFSLPEWLKDWDCLEENDHDSKEMKALKVRHLI
jgi:hypothetical protein